MTVFEQIVRPSEVFPSSGGTRKAKGQAPAVEARLEWGNGGGYGDAKELPISSDGGVTIETIGTRPDNSALGTEEKRATSEQKVIFRLRRPIRVNRHGGRKFEITGLEVTYVEMTSLEFFIPQMPFKRPGTEEVALDAEDGIIDFTSEDFAGYHKAYMSFTLKPIPFAQSGISVWI